jgi:hypothetical protein
MGLISEIMDRGRWWRRYDGWSDHKGRDFLFSLIHYLQLWFFSFLFFLFICSLTLKFFILPILFLHSNFALTFFLHISSLFFFFFSFYYGSFLFIPLFIVRFLLILSPSLTFHTFLLSCFFSSIIIFYHYLFTFKLLGKGLEMFILVLHPVFNYYHAR